MGRVSKHRILDLGNLFRCVMPGFMDKRGIAGNGIDFAFRLLKGFIFGSKIFQFRGANKGKVCRVEEKEGPFTKNVFLAHVCEFIMVKGLDGKSLISLLMRLIM